MAPLEARIKVFAICSLTADLRLQVKLKGREWYDNKFAPCMGPIALLALLYTIFVLFALQGHSVRDTSWLAGCTPPIAVVLVLTLTLMPNPTLNLT